MKPKPTFTRPITESEWARTIYALAIFFGLVVRVLPALLVDFPINDGGMFAVMINDLLSNHWFLPFDTTYNYSNIPFAYPPLGMYLGAILQIIGFENETIFLWFPVLLSVLLLPVYYLFARELFESRSHAATATLFLALAPGTYVWYLMGGGLTRALGVIFFLLGLTFTLRAFRRLEWEPVLIAMLFCGLAVLTHPQAALLTLTGSAVLFLFYGRSWTGILKASCIALGAALVASFWWVNLIFNHGVHTLLSGGQSGSLFAPLTALLQGLTSRQTFLPFAMIFWLLGLGWVIYKRRFDLFLLGAVLYFIDQRSAPAMSFYIFPLWASYGYMDCLPSCLTWIREKRPLTGFSQSLFDRPAFSLGLLGITFYLFIECVFHANVIAKLSLPIPARQMMTWVQENTASDSRFLIITGRQDAMTDPVQEWFPVLAKRHSETTLQGLEWLLAEDFNTRWDALNSLQGCKESDCVISQAESLQLDSSMIILDLDNLSVSSFEKRDYQVVYQNEQYAVLETK